MLNTSGNLWKCPSCGQMVSGFHNCMPNHQTYPIPQYIPPYYSYPEIKVLERIAEALEKIVEHLEKHGEQTKEG